MENRTCFDPTDKLSLKHCKKMVDDYQAEHDGKRLSYEQSLEYIKTHSEPLEKVG